MCSVSVHLPRRARRAGDDDQRGEVAAASAPRIGRQQVLEVSRAGGQAQLAPIIIPALLDPQVDGDCPPRSLAAMIWRPAPIGTWPLPDATVLAAESTIAGLTRYDAARANPRRVLFARARCRSAPPSSRDGGHGIPLRGRTMSTSGYASWASRIRRAEVYNSRNYPRAGARRLSLQGCSGAAIFTGARADRQPGPQHLRVPAARRRQADVMITGVTRLCPGLSQIRRVLDPRWNPPFGPRHGRPDHTVFIADTTVTERPTAEQLAQIAIQTAGIARRMGHEPRVAFLSIPISAIPRAPISSGFARA